jgi:CheY-like chemotaxis protein
MPIQKVLVVDDSKTELMFMTDLLQKNGFAVRPPRTPRTRSAACPKTSRT